MSSSKEKDERDSVYMPKPTESNEVAFNDGSGQPPLGYVANFTSVLNDPSEYMDSGISLTSLYEYLTTPTLKDKELPEPIPLSEVSLQDFAEYLTEFGDSFTKNVKASARFSAEAKRQESDTTFPTGLESIPESYFSPDFTLTDPGVLDQHGSGLGNDVGAGSGEGEGEFGGANVVRNILPGHTLLLERMSTQLDVVEMRLINQISKRSNAIFSSLADFRRINDRVKAACEEIAALRATINRMDDDMVLNALKVAKLKRKRANCMALLHMIRLVKTVSQTQPTVQLLLSTSDFAGALDLLESTQEILRGELSGVHAFKHLHAQLSELTVAIEKMMRSELVRVALELNTEEDEGEDDEGNTIRAQLESELIPVVLGLKRIGKLQAAIQEYREKSVERVRPTLRATVMNGTPGVNPSSSSSSSSSTNGASASELAAVVRDQDPAEFLSLLDALFVAMGRLIRRSYLVHNIVWSVLARSSSNRGEGEGYDDYMAFDGAGAVGVDMESVNNMENKGIANEALDIVVAVAEECHQRIARLLQLRDEVHARLTFDDFVKLYASVMAFIKSAESMCKRTLRGLKGPLLQQSKAFLETHHSKEMQSLTLLLNGEMWQSCEVGEMSQCIVDRWVSVATRTSITKEKEKEKEKENEKEKEKEKKNKHLEVNGKRYKLVNVLLYLIKVIDDYLKIADMFPTLATDVLSRMVELFKLFNSKSCQLILGAGALQHAGLKSITATHLALVSQCLGLLIEQIPLIAIIMGRILPSSHAVLLTELDKVVDDCARHRQEIFGKLIAIMRERVDFHCKAFPKIPWDDEIEHEHTSKPILSLSKETTTMHKKLSQTLQSEELRKVFGGIVTAMIGRVGSYIDLCNVETPLGRRRLRVDIQHFNNTLKGLKGIDAPGTQLLDRIYSKSTSSSSSSSVLAPHHPSSSSSSSVSRKEREGGSVSMSQGDDRDSAIPPRSASASTSLLSVSDPHLGTDKTASIPPTPPSKPKPKAKQSRKFMNV